MRNISRPAAAVATISLSALCFLLVPTGAAAEAAPVGSTKAGIEYAERMAAAADARSKAQIEYDERTSLAPAGGQERQAPVSDPASSDNSAAAWQLALSAAVGAVLTGGVVLATRQVNHRYAIAA